MVSLLVPSILNEIKALYHANEVEANAVLLIRIMLRCSLFVKYINSERV